jgi:methyltransferase (TIGR00027 family)
MIATLPVDSVTDTAYLTAYCRALESERPDARFRDPYARSLAGDRGRDLLRRLPAPHLTVSGCTVRTCVVDELILSAIQAGTRTIVNLGAGLDARPYRLPLPAEVHWIEVDTPPTLAFKDDVLRDAAAPCRLTRVPLDVADDQQRRRFLREVAAERGAALALTEGLLIYMTAPEVAQLARDLYTWPHCHFWISDLVSPAALRLMGSVTPDSSVQDRVLLRFAPEQGSSFFQAHHWHTAESRSCLLEGERLERPFVDGAAFPPNLSKEQLQVLRELFVVVRMQRAKNWQRLQDSIQSSEEERRW